MNKKIEVCFSPALYELHKNTDSIVVVVDILRATTSICTAIENGVGKLIPVATQEDAKAYKNKGYLVAAERNGIRLDFADLGNSPDNFTSEIVKGKDIVYSTTNGTKTIMMAADCKAVVIGAFLNLSALCTWLISQKNDVLILCSGWKNRFNLEDSVFAGAVVEQLLESNTFETNCDSAKAALNLWQNNKNDMHSFMLQCAHSARLKKNGLDNCIDYCISIDVVNSVPILKENFLTKIG